MNDKKNEKLNNNDISSSNNNNSMNKYSYSHKINSSYNDKEYSAFPISNELNLDDKDNWMNMRNVKQSDIKQQLVKELTEKEYIL